MERVANQTWDTGIGPERRIIARVDAACEWGLETKPLDPSNPTPATRDGGHKLLEGTSRLP